MGADGGSIPKRCEMVRTAKRSEKTHSSALILANWTTCDLSKEPLSFPVVACRLGRIYSKCSILQLLIVKRKNLEFPFSDKPERYAHINSLKDIQELAIKIDFLNYICPVTGRPLNGINEFVFIKGCGCIFSESLFKNASFNFFLCPVCSYKYTKEDIISLDPTPAPLRSHPSHPTKDIINEKYLSLTVSNNHSDHTSQTVTDRNADYNPSTNTSLSSIVQDKLSTAKGISSINSIYYKQKR